MNKLINSFKRDKLLFLFLPLFLEGKCFAAPGLCLGHYIQQKEIVVQILDEHNKPTAEKITVTANDSIYYAPDGHLSDFKISKGGSDAMLADNKRFAYVERIFSINLPAVTFRFEVVKGYAYRFFDSIIHISSETDTVKIQLQKWFEFDKGKWYSGDVHLHYLDPVTALLEMKAEDLNICNILT